MIKILLDNGLTKRLNTDVISEAFILDGFLVCECDGVTHYFNKTHVIEVSIKEEHNEDNES